MNNTETNTPSRCPSCGTDKTVEHNGGKWCPTCGIFVTSPNREQSNIDKPQESANQSQVAVSGDCVFEVVRDVLIKLGNTFMYSDLFVTADRLIYVRLAFVIEPQGGFAGVATDGPRGYARMLGLVDKKREFQEAANTARASAAEQRNRFFGLSLEARSGREGRGSLIIQRGNIQDFKLHPGSDDIGVIEIVLRNGNSFITENTGATQLCDRLNLWLSGKPLHVDCDRQGLDLSLPQPGEILSWIENPSGSPKIKLDDCERAAKVTTYCKELAEQLKKRTWPQRERLCQLARDRSLSLASGLGAALAASPGGGKSEGVAFLCGVFAAVGIVCGGGTWLDSKVGSSDYTIGGWIAVAGIGLGILALWPLSLALRDRKRNRQLSVKLLEQPR